MKTHRFYRKIKILILIILSFVLLAVFLNYYLLPVKLKSFLEASLTTALEKPVSFQRLGFNMLKGVVINDITVFEDEERSGVFLKADRISFNPLLAPILLKKKIIITSLVIEELDAAFQRDNKGNLDILDIIKPPSKEQTQSKYSLTVTDVTLKNSILTLRDNYPKEPQVFTFENVDAQAGFSLPAKIKFSFKGNLKDKAKNISLKGNYYLKNKYLDLNLDCLEVNIYKFFSYFQEKLNFALEKDTTDIAANIVINANKELIVEGTSYLNDTKASFASLVLEGDMIVK